MTSKVLAAFCTFGNLAFSKLTLQSLKENTKHPMDYFVIVGKPGDQDTINWLVRENIPFKAHDQNYGFPYSVNDCFDYAWKENNYDYLILAGNDIYAYPFCVDSLINLADESDYDLISATQLDVRTFCSLFPQARGLFQGEDYKFSSFESNIWNLFKDYSPEYQIADMQLMDIENCALYKKSVFDITGYTDVAFFPAYWIDNDHSRRIANSNLKYCSLANAKFFHFWSRTIKQGSGGSTNHYFENNRKYYETKWGGTFGEETIQAPIKIDSREHELEIINYWRTH